MNKQYISPVRHLKDRAPSKSDLIFDYFYIEKNKFNMILIEINKKIQNISYHFFRWAIK